ncbi:Transcriptional regulator, MarR family [Devosia sp. LC5]|uniref:MarR family winged helix-turn-helix transcriptional regulator n=1 Tax=Devosia sp. LC5 TaxID=1502724 RepID=UPI0004E30556|nr:MarR family winged helix-turn-helix transcriptional regulator [Devosia sp. LC5]KFC71210.1 Transcriptional regulator, MarR family [Devosia sp. LC5]
MNEQNPAPPGKAPRRRFRADVVTGIVGYRLRRAQIAVFQQFIARFAAHDLRPADYSALALIEANPGSKQIEIARALGIKRANFVALINGLEGRGLVERRQPADDRRSQALYLTQRGIEQIAVFNKVQADFEAHCIDKLGGVAARDQLMDLLGRLLIEE